MSLKVLLGRQPARARADGTGTLPPALPVPRALSLTVGQRQLVRLDESSGDIALATHGRVLVIRRRRVVSVWVALWQRCVVAVAQAPRLLCLLRRR